jgi:hypothetical protein
MEKTGLEVLVDLVEQVKLLNKKFDVIDRNIKMLMNARPKEEPAKQVQQIQQIDPPKAPGMRFGFEKTGPTTAPSATTPGAMVSSKVAVMLGSTATPIIDAVVKIYDANDALIKETKTNKAGEWRAKLSPGKYVANIEGNFRGKPLISQNKMFEVEMGMDRMEVY